MDDNNLQKTQQILNDEFDIVLTLEELKSAGRNFRLKRLVRGVQVQTIMQRIRGITTNILDKLRKIHEFIAQEYDDDRIWTCLHTGIPLSEQASNDRVAYIQSRWYGKLPSCVDTSKLMQMAIEEDDDLVFGLCIDAFRAEVMDVENETPGVTNSLETQALTDAVLCQCKNILRFHPLPPELLETIIHRVVEIDNLNMFKFLEEKYPSNVDENVMMLLTIAAEANASNVFDYLLKTQGFGENPYLELAKNRCMVGVHFLAKRGMDWIPTIHKLLFADDLEIVNRIASVVDFSAYDKWNYLLSGLIFERHIHTAMEFIRYHHDKLDIDWIDTMISIVSCQAEIDEEFFDLCVARSMFPIDEVWRRLTTDRQDSVNNVLITFLRKRSVAIDVEQFIIDWILTGHHNNLRRIQSVDKERFAQLFVDCPCDNFLIPLVYEEGLISIATYLQMVLKRKMSTYYIDICISQMPWIDALHQATDKEMLNRLCTSKKFLANIQFDQVLLQTIRCDDFDPFDCVFGKVLSKVRSEYLRIQNNHSNILTVAFVLTLELKREHMTLHYFKAALTMYEKLFFLGLIPRDRAGLYATCLKHIQGLTC